MDILDNKMKKAREYGKNKEEQALVKLRKRATRSKPGSQG